MSPDKIIACPKSGGDLCYETQVTPEITNWMSLSCGYWTNSLMTKDSDFYKEQFEVLPELYKALAWEDPETKLTWLPQTINLPTQGMVFANGTSSDNWKWAAVKATQVTEEEKEKYPIPKQPGKFYEYRMNMETLQHFEERDFIDALEYIGLIGK
jgi:hypothetical protein